MTKDELREGLRAYKGKKARLAAIEPEVERMQAALAKAEEDAPVDMACKGVNYSGASGGGGKSSPVERAVLSALDGKEPEQLRAWREELKTLECERQELQWWLRRMDAALSALTDDERTVAERHLVEHDSWTRLEAESRRLLGRHQSMGTLRAICDKALGKMLEVLA